jgi:3'-phosphoadenosine 5'-phosphosulfate sulfotransferase (PAPS reductase)/FAD synthetase
MSAIVSLAEIAPAQSSFVYDGSQAHAVALTPEVEDMLRANCVVAIGVSGGKDSVACALAVARHLDEIGHTGPCVLVHAELGSIEWRDSLPSCERLAAHLGWELLVVKRAAGDLVARWRGRLANNVERYRNLQCVKLVLPWSTPSMRFCTSELKTQVIASALRKRFPAQPILNVTGIRWQESARRSEMPIAKPMAQLERKAAKGLAWNAIIDWRLSEVLSIAQDAGLAPHAADAVYGASRVSCAYCIMSTAEDLLAATRCTDNHEVYRTLVELEAESTFAFQGARWLGDVAPSLLSEELRSRLVDAKAKAEERKQIESVIPDHLLYVKGWPTALPTKAEAELIADVRSEMNDLMGLDMHYLAAESVLARYSELMAASKVKTKNE